MDYSEKLKDPRWQRARLKIMERDGFACVACSSTTETLTVHHIHYSGSNPWDAPDKDLQTLCFSCHDRLGKHSKGGIGYELAVDGLMLPVAGPHCPSCGGKIKDKGAYCRCVSCGWSTWDYMDLGGISVRDEP